MSVTLKSDNRQLTANSKYSYLVDNYSSGVSSVAITNTEGFSADNFIFIEDVGKETAEIFRIGSLDTTTGVLTLQTAGGSTTTTKFSHSESTKVYVLPYNQIRFYWTAALGTIADEDPTFAQTTPLTDWQDLEPASWYTSYSDSAHSTGFGWFLYRNSLTNKWSAVSNPIPYAGFSGNTVAQVFKDFDSLMSTNELRLITMEEKFSWLNEAIALLRNKLNLCQDEYYSSSEQILSILSGTSEYQLPSDFSDLTSLRYDDSYHSLIPYISVHDSATYRGSSPRYYLRGRYLGIVPTPTQDTTYYYRYMIKSTTISSLSTYLDLPDNAFYSLKDFMCYRAFLKLQNPIAQQYFAAFMSNINLYVQSSVQRSDELLSWTIGLSQNT